MQYVPLFKKQGLDVEVFVLPKKRTARYWFILTLGRFDVIVLQKRLLSPLLLKVLRKKAARLVFDYDDAVMFSQDSTEFAEPSGRRLKRFAGTVKAADCVIAGNSYLADFARRYTGCVKVIPSMPVPIPGASAQHGISEHVVVGWMGSASNIGYLDELKPVFDELAEEFPCFKFKMVSDRIWENARECSWFEFKPWSMLDEGLDLTSFDVGIMPLDDNVWTRGKCGFKLLQYFSAAKPVVTSPVGVNAEFVQNGVNGYLASNADDWKKALTDLLLYSDLRHSMGQASKKRFDEDFCLEKWAAEFERIIRHGS